MKGNVKQKVTGIATKILPLYMSLSFDWNGIFCMTWYTEQFIIMKLYTVQLNECV